MNLTRNPVGGKDAGATGGAESSDVATGGSGGSGTVETDAASAGAGGGVAAGGATGGATTGGDDGAPTTGGTGGTEADGAAEDLEPDAGVVADASDDRAIDAPFSTDTNLPVDQRTGDTATGDGRTGGTGGTATGGTKTGGTGGTATGGTRTGGTGGRATGGTGGTSVVDAAADATSSGDVGIDAPADTILPSDLGTGGADGAGPDGAGDTSDAATDSAGTGGAGGAGGAGGMGTGGTGGTGTGGTTGPVIISIDFVGGRPTAAGVAMALTESAGVKWVANWNSAWNNTGTLSSLWAADGSTTSAWVNWYAPLATGETSATWTVPFSDNTGDAHMMNGYLDPKNASPATIDMSVPSSMSGGFDVYVYCYGNNDTRTRTFQYSIGSASHTVSQAGVSATSFSGYALAPEGGAGNYVVFRNVTATTFTVKATPFSSSVGTSLRAPVNGIQIVFPAGS